MIRYIIKGNPISSKNSRPVFINQATGKRFIGKSKKLKEYTQSALWQLKGQPSNGYDLPINTNISVAFIFYVKDKRRRDLVNFCQLPADLLQQANIIADDSLIKSLDGSRILIDKDNPRTEISIKNYED